MSISLFFSCVFDILGVWVLKLAEDDNGSGAIPTPKPAPKVAAPAAPKAAAPAPAKKEAAAPRKQQNNRDRAPRQPRGEEPGSSVGEVFDSAFTILSPFLWPSLVLRGGGGFGTFLQLLTLRASLSISQSDDESPPLPEEAEEEPSESPLALPPTEVSTRSPEDTCTYQFERLFCPVARCPDPHFACPSHSDSQKKIENGSGHLTGTLLASWHATSRPFTYSSSVFVPFRFLLQVRLSSPTRPLVPPTPTPTLRPPPPLVSPPPPRERSPRRRRRPPRGGLTRRRRRRTTPSPTPSTLPPRPPPPSRASPSSPSESSASGPERVRSSRRTLRTPSSPPRRRLRRPSRPERRRTPSVSSPFFRRPSVLFPEDPLPPFSRSRSTESSPLRRSPLPPPEVDEVDSRVDEVESDEREVLPEEAEEELEVPSEATPEVPPPSPERRRPPPSTLPTRPPSPRSPKARPGPTFAVVLQPRVAFRLSLA